MNLTYRQTFKFEGWVKAIGLTGFGEVPLPGVGLDAAFEEAKRSIEKQFPGIVLSRLELVGAPMVNQNSDETLKPLTVS